MRYVIGPSIEPETPSHLSYKRFEEGCNDLEGAICDK